MLTYFPTVYPGELLYSVLARYHRHVGAPSPMHTLDALFGNRKVIATFDLPGHLQALADRLPPDRALNVDRVIDTLTLYPYLTAFEPPALQEKVRRAMGQGAIDGLHVRLGLSAFRIGRVQQLRFCPTCAWEMKALYGELWWRRDHQLPGVIACPEHGCPLLDSVVTRCGMMALFATTALLRCQRRFIDTTYPTDTGNCWSPICRGERGFGVGLRRTTANSSMPCSGFFAPVHRGETCRPRMVGGKIPIDVFAAGVTRAFGSRCSSSSLRSLILNGC